MTPFSLESGVMRGLDPRVHVLAAEEDVDGRIKSGHDDLEDFQRHQHHQRTDRRPKRGSDP